MARGGRPPEDGRDWVDSREAARLLGIHRQGALRMARMNGLTLYQEKRCSQGWFLREEVVSFGDFRKLRLGWWARHRPVAGERLTERADVGWAREVLISVREAAARLGVGLHTVHSMVMRGRLTSWQSRPGCKGSRLWLSPTQIERLLEDGEWRRRQRCYATGYGGRKLREADWERGLRVEDRAVVALRRWEGGRSEELLSVCQVGVMLGVHRNTVLSLMKRGRLHGVQIWRGGKPLRYWYFYREEVEAWWGSEAYQEFRERWRESYQRGL